MKRTPLVASLVLVTTTLAASNAFAQRPGVVVVGPRGGAVGVQPVQPRRNTVVVQSPQATVVVQPPRGGVVVQPPRGGYVAQPPPGGVVVQPQQPAGWGRPQGAVVAQPPNGGIVVQPGLPQLPRPPVIVAQPGGGRPMMPGPSRVVVAPPAVRVDAPAGPPPGAGYVWIPGYNHWTGSSYYWVGGHYEMPPQQGVVWIAPRTIQQSGYVDYYPGYWSTPDYAQSYYGQQQGYGEMQLQVGTSMQGMLQYGDRASATGALVNDYIVSLSPGQTISIAVHGGPSWTTPGGRLDPMVQVLAYTGPQMQQYGGGYQNAAPNEFVLAQDDDSAGNQDSLLIFTPVRPGAYRIRVTSYGGGANQGYYTLNTRYGAQLGGL